MTDPGKTPTRPPAGSLHCPNCGAAAGLDAKECTYCHAPLATMSCPSCFNRVFIGAAYCPHCGTHVSRQDDGTAAAESCPGCRGQMASVHIGTITVSECSACGGVWLDADEFDRLCADRESLAAVVHGNALRGGGASNANGAPGAARRPEKITYRPCPRCKKMMNRVNFAKYSGVILDVCRAHGTFFDADELHRVVAFIQAGGLDRARDRDREELADAERRLRAMQNIHDATPILMAGEEDGVSTRTRAFEAFISLLFHPE